jgi:hypothetical protein
VEYYQRDGQSQLVILESFDADYRISAGFGGAGVSGGKIHRNGDAIGQTRQAIDGIEGADLRGGDDAFADLDAPRLGGKGKRALNLPFTIYDSGNE